VQLLLSGPTYLAIFTSLAVRADAFSATLFADMRPHATKPARVDVPATWAWEMRQVVNTLPCKFTHPLAHVGWWLDRKRERAVTAGNTRRSCSSAPALSDLWANAVACTFSKARERQAQGRQQGWQSVRRRLIASSAARAGQSCCVRRPRLARACERGASACKPVRGRAGAGEDSKATTATLCGNALRCNSVPGLRLCPRSSCANLRTV
jgi:hypothetical protein